MAHGARVNAKDNDKNTPLHCLGIKVLKKDRKNELIVDYGKECCEFLLRSGANINESNIFGNTPLANYFVKELKREVPQLFELDDSSC